MRACGGVRSPANDCRWSMLRYSGKIGAGMSRPAFRALHGPFKLGAWLSMAIASIASHRDRPGRTAMQGPSEGDELSQLAPTWGRAARAPSPANTAALREYIKVRAGAGRQGPPGVRLHNATARQLSAAGTPSPPAGAGGQARQPAGGLHRAAQAARRHRTPPAAPLLHHQVAVSELPRPPSAADWAAGSLWA